MSYYWKNKPLTQTECDDMLKARERLIKQNTPEDSMDDMLQRLLHHITKRRREVPTKKQK